MGDWDGLQCAPHLSDLAFCHRSPSVATGPLESTGAGQGGGKLLQRYRKEFRDLSTVHTLRERFLYGLEPVVHLFCQWLGFFRLFDFSC